MHPTVFPDEGLAHADAVVIGEAEELWGPLLDDVARGTLQQVYRGDRFQPWAYMATNCVQATRGCPYGCDFLHRHRVLRGQVPVATH
jgi:radical SAM superfamily enzyme YgiQ (UPF0313 family)